MISKNHLECFMALVYYNETVFAHTYLTSLFPCISCEINHAEFALYIY